MRGEEKNKKVGLLILGWEMSEKKEFLFYKF